MDLAKDLAWQKIFSGRSTNLKIEKSRFFCIFATFTPYFILFTDNQWTYEFTTENIDIKLTAVHLKKYSKFTSAIHIKTNSYSFRIMFILIIVQFFIICSINGWKYEKVSKNWDRVTNWCVYLTARLIKPLQRKISVVSFLFGQTNTVR